ncbi:MAG: glycoside hydrolase family 3 C-terminal domain-containing protein [Bacteroidales bacterium]|nr:glycoside hydrolase family 3 C-terminal domain-containing protein [Bacteroidales bacterium]
MRKLTIFLLVATAVFSSLVEARAQKLPYQDESLPIGERVEDLLQRMTVDEKIDLMRATSPANERLGIAKYYHGNEALHGVVRPGRFTVFPQAIALASSWDPELMLKVSTAISDEARARWNELGEGKLQTNQFSDLLTFWSPTVNMVRDPRWGRTPETYGEDPFLTGEMGTAFVRGLQGDDPRYLKVVSTPKHFAANNEEHNRFECDAEISEKQLREYYLPAYEALVKRGHAASIMASYNAINGIPSSANPWLLTKVLRDDWGFEGYVVSDCGGPSTLVEDHHYVAKRETAAALCLLSGLDLECGDNYYIEPLRKAYRLGMVKDEDIDRAARRILTARMRLGIFDSGEANPYTKISPEVIGSEKHQALALEMARESIALLKNEKGTLPLRKGKIRSIAVVGINAGTCEFGDYSGTPASVPVSILDGINAAVGKDIKVNYAPWKTAADGMELIAPEYFPGGLKAEYFKGTELKGEPKVRTDEWINFEPTNQAPDPFLPDSPMSVRWTGVLRPNITGEYKISFTSDDGCRLWIDGELVIDSWGQHNVRSDNIDVRLEAGKDYKIVAEYWNLRDYSVAKLSWNPPVLDGQSRLALYGKAGEMAAKSDVVIAVMGINKTIEREGKDRDFITLPSDQQEFLKELYHVNKNIVLVLVAGSPLSILWEDKNIPAIVNAWYPGEKGGTAVADVLFGNYNPAGRLPVTYYNRIEDLPAFDDYDITKRTYKYFEGDVLYPFGYGLSYTSFKYSGLKVEDKGENVEVSFTLRNIGKYDGDEVAQVYVRLPEYEGQAPIKELRGFKRVHLKKGESRVVTIPVRREDLRYWSDSQKKFIIPEGLPEIMVGASSADIRLVTQ